MRVCKSASIRALFDLSEGQFVFQFRLLQLSLYVRSSATVVILYRADDQTECSPWRLKHEHTVLWSPICASDFVRDIMHVKISFHLQFVDTSLSQLACIGGGGPSAVVVVVDDDVQYMKV